MNKKTYLIGPEYFSKYIFVLKIVMWAVFLGASIATVVGGVFSPDKSLVDIVAGYLGGVISGLAQSFAWVTIIFAFIEYRGVDVSGIPDEELKFGTGRGAKAARDKSLIPIGEAIAGIIFTTIFMAILILAPQILAAYIPVDNDVIRIPFFNMTELEKYNMYILVIFILSIARETAKIVYRRWNIKSAIVYSVLSVISMALFIAVFFRPEVWNPDFYTELPKHLKLSSVNTWDTISRSVKNGVVALFFIGTFIDIATAMYKGIKYQSREF